jgi:hypothetical protein
MRREPRAEELRPTTRGAAFLYESNLPTAKTQVPCLISIADWS